MIAKIEQVYQLTSDYFCCGIETEKGIVKKTAPIVKYMQGWIIQAVQIYRKSKGWKIDRLA